MSSLILVLVGLAMMAAGYLLYSKFLGKRVYQLSDAYTTPAHTMEDGVDFVPTNKYVLWGHHFTSVAGAAPHAARPTASTSAAKAAPRRVSRFFSTVLFFLDMMPRSLPLGGRREGKAGPTTRAVAFLDTAVC